MRDLGLHLNLEVSVTFSAQVAALGSTDKHSQLVGIPSKAPQLGAM